MKKTDDSEMTTGSGLLRGSEPLRDVQHRSAAKKDGDDSGKDNPLGGEKGDDDSTDADKSDADLTDKGDGGEDSADSDGKD